jgi:hypothetical protein
MFPEVEREAMRRGASSKWAADLTEDDLRAVIWMVGEFGRRAPHVLAGLDQQWAESPPPDLVAATRAKLALEGLFRIVCGERPSVEEFAGRWGSVAERVWAAAQSRAPELPAEEMGDRWPVEWEGRSVGWLKDPRHGWLGCTGLWVPAIPESEAFAAALGAGSRTPLVISVGGVPSVVDEPPSPMNELRISWAGPGT